MPSKVKQEFIDYLKKDNVLVAKIADICKVSTTTISRNWLYRINDEKLLQIDVLRLIEKHLQNSTSYKINSFDDILIEC